MTTLADRTEIIEALSGDDPAWVSAAYGAVEQIATRLARLTTDEIWPLVTFPTGVGGGKAMGKVVRWALASRMMEKATWGGYLLCLDHTTLDPVRTLDGTLIRHQGPVVVYRSLLFDGCGHPDSGVDLSDEPGRFAVPGDQPAPRLRAVLEL